MLAMDSETGISRPRIDTHRDGIMTINCVAEHNQMYELHVV